jgi:hypothetical protein
VISDRVSSSPETLEKHYSQMTGEKLEQRREYLNEM